MCICVHLPKEAREPSRVSMCVQLHIYQGGYARVYMCICRRKPENHFERPSSDIIHLSYDTRPFTYLELAK